LEFAGVDVAGSAKAAGRKNEMDAGKLAEYDDRLNAYLRLSSFPVAVRFLRNWDEVPLRATCWPIVW